MPFIKSFLSAKSKHFPNLLYAGNKLLELKWGDIYEVIYYQVQS